MSPPEKRVFHRSIIESLDLKRQCVLEVLADLHEITIVEDKAEASHG